MNTNQRIEYIFYAILSFFIRIFIQVKPKHWVFSADYGKSYREGSKYLLEYMLENHPDYKCTFITKSRDVYNELKAKNIPCEMNFSICGVIRISEADSVFFTQYLRDVDLVSKRKGRLLFYLMHGQPFKVALKMLEAPEKNYKSKVGITTTPWTKIKDIVINILGRGYDITDVYFVSATSQFEANLMRNEFDESVKIKILGMPRNDVLFQPDKMKEMKWLKGFDDKYIITYMPTHRQYGKGKVSPVPFKDREDVQQWMRDNNIILLIKQHPNMLQRMGDTYESDVILDISKIGYDPQTVIFHTNTLITDYSSVWIDYLLLHRPLVFYFYDNFEEDDAGCYYNLREEFPNNYCESEDDLFNYLRCAYENKSLLTPSENKIRKYHKFVDGDSCKRYYEEIVKRYRNH